MTPVFAHAAASFDPTPDGVLLWTRLTGATEASWVLAEDAELSAVVDSGTAVTGPQRDGTIVVDVTGLEPGTTYWYRFSAGDHHSPVGRTRTLPGTGAGELVLGMVSCADYSVAPLTVYRALAQHEVDLVIHLGDYVYDTDGSGGRREHEPPHPVRSLADYRARLAQIRRDPDCQALHLAHPMAAVVDDHDLADNAWRNGAKSHTETEDGPWSARALAAMTARSEWLPTRRRDDADVMTTWRALTVDGLADVLLLDSRLCGRDEQAGEPGALALEAPDRTILGPEQRDWALALVGDATQPWSLVANGVVVNEIVLRPPMARLLAPLLPEGYAEHGGELLRADQWDGYPAERRRLVSAMAKRRAGGGGTVLLSGDVHSSWAMDGPCGDDGRPIAVEMVTPSVSSAPMGRTRLPVMWRGLDAAVRRLEHVRFVNVTNRGFTVLHVTPERATAGWYFVDPYDASDTPAAEPDTWLSVNRLADPPSWQPAAAPSPLRRPGPGPAPARPDDVPAARRSHQRRRAAGLGAVGLLAAAALHRVVRLLSRDR